MEITAWQIFFGSVLGIALMALLGIAYRQGQSPTRKEMHDLHRQLREELRGEIREAVRTAVIEITAYVDHRIDEVNHRIDEVNHRIDDTNQQIAGIRQDINRVLAALASHEHINGRVVVNVQPDIEPAPTAADN